MWYIKSYIGEFACEGRLPPILLMMVNAKKTLHKLFSQLENFSYLCIHVKRKAMMAQLVEQRIRNAWVAGSSPARGSLYLLGL